MHRVIELNPDEQHTTCYACNKIVPWKKRKTHWMAACNSNTHGMIDYNHMTPFSLYDPLPPSSDTTASTLSIAHNEHDTEQPGENETDNVVEEDHIYPGVGMYIFRFQSLIDLGLPNIRGKYFVHYRHAE